MGLAEGDQRGPIIKYFVGNPNGMLLAENGDLSIDSKVGTMYINISPNGRGTVWVTLGGGGCDDACDCIEELVHFKDEFCDLVPTPENGESLNPHWEVPVVGAGLGSGVSNLQRSNGWWRIREVGGGGPEFTTLLQERFHCYAFAEQQQPGPPVPTATIRYKTKLFLSEYSTTLSNGTPQFRAGLRNSFDGRGASFHTRHTGDFPFPLSWDAVLVSTTTPPPGGAIVSVIQTDVPVARNCRAFIGKGDILFPGAQLLEMEMSLSGGVIWKIDGVVVRTLLPTDPLLIGLTQDVFKAFYETTQVQQDELIAADLDYICVTQTPRLCVDKLNPEF